LLSEKGKIIQFDTDSSVSFDDTVIDKNSFQTNVVRITINSLFYSGESNSTAVSLTPDIAKGRGQRALMQKGKD
jgi:hypothetical protein